MEGFDSYALEIGKDLRNSSINTEVVFGLKGSFKYADKLNIPYVIVVGEEEAKTNKYTLKDMTSGEQKMLSKEELIKKLEEILV
jgi:histidyl-tRNA synthetase